MLMMTPLSRVSISGNTVRVTVTSPLVLVSIIVSHSSSELDCAGAVPKARPALFTSTSIGFQSAGSCASALSTEARSVTSIVTGSRRSPSSPCSRARRSVRRAAAMTQCPLATNLRAIASPKPALAPVIRTIMWFSLADSKGLFYHNVHNEHDGKATATLFSVTARHVSHRAGRAGIIPRRGRAASGCPDRCGSAYASAA